MKKSLHILASAAAVAVLFAASCAKEQQSPDKNRPSAGIPITVRAALPAPSEDAETRLSMDPSVSNKFAWDGGENMYVLAGKITDGTLVQKVFSLTGGTGEDGLGEFTGAMDFGTTGLTVSDILGVVISESKPKLENPSGTTIRITLPRLQKFTQKKGGVLDGAHAGAYSLISSGNITEDGDGYAIDGIVLSYAKPVLCLNIYDSSGTLDGWKLKSVQLVANYINGDTYVNAATGAVTGAKSNNYKTATVSDQPLIPSDKEDGVKVFFAFGAPASQKLSYANITLTNGTEDLSIQKIIGSGSGLTMTFAAGKVYSAGFDLGNIYEPLEYSTDGGTTWGSALPTEEFGALAVRRNSDASTAYPLAPCVLAKIKACIDSYAADDGAVLDLSRITYSGTTFPAIFGNTTPDSEEPCGRLAGISLPSNITAIPDSCFRHCVSLKEINIADGAAISVGEEAFYGCTSLESVDFAKVKSIGAFAFGNVPLNEVNMSASPAGTTVAGYAFVSEDKSANTTIRRVTVSKNVSMESYAFFRLHGLQYLYLDSPGASHAFAWQTTAYVTTGYSHLTDLTVVMGPNVSVTDACFWCNANVSRVVLEDGATGLDANTFGICRYLKEIESLATEAAPTIVTTTFRYYSGTNAARSTGNLVSDKKLIVPSGKEGLYASGVWKTTVQDNLGYVLQTVTPVSDTEAAAQKEALMAIWNATGGAEWKNNTGWGGDGAIGTWAGVTTDATGLVTSLDLSSNELAGELPDVFDKLPGLTTLRLNNNALTGQLPQSLRNLSAAGFKAYLRYNNFETTTFKVPNDRIETVAEAFQVYPSSNPDFRFHVDSEVDGTGEIHPDCSAVLYMAATEGAGVDFYIIGEGYDAEENTVGGTVDYWYKVAADAFFDIEPMGKLKKYFNVWFIYAHSPQKGISMYTSKINSKFGYCLNQGASETLRIMPVNFISAALGRTAQTPSATQVCINSTHNAIGGGICWTTATGYSFGCCQTRPTAFRGLVKHETGGHGQGRLVDEYTGSRTNLSAYLYKINPSPNTDIESDPTKVKWAQFIADPRYENEDLGVYEGGCGFKTGVYRPSATSMMYASGQRTNMYNAPSRAAIYQRVMSRAFPGTFTWDYEEFVKFDLGLE